MGEEYKYPDQNEKMIKQITNNIKSYWDESNKRVFSTVKNSIRESFSSLPISLLDLGCGESRLLIEFKDYYDSALGIDLDKTRLNKGREKVKTLGIDHKISYLHTSSMNLNMDNSFDVVICSQVIQHTNPFTYKKIVNDIYRMLKKGGICYLSTSHSIEGEHVYTFTYEEKNVVKNKRISYEDFFSITLEEKQTGLPCCSYNQDLLKKELNDIGFIIKKFEVFHVDNEELVKEKSVQVDDYINESNERQRMYGKDMYFILSK